jgi:hypothetical protein
LEKPQFKISKNRLKLVLENKNYKTENRKEINKKKKETASGPQPNRHSPSDQSISLAQ